MRTELKEIQIEIVKVEHYDLGCRPICTYETNEYPDEIKAYKKIQIPETIKEFCELNKIPKKQLVKWLVKNYK